MNYTVTLSDLERGVCMDLADAQARVAYYTRNLHHPRNVTWSRQRAWLRDRIAAATADILEARGRIVALAKARVTDRCDNFYQFERDGERYAFRNSAERASLRAMVKGR